MYRTAAAIETSDGPRELVYLPGAVQRRGGWLVDLPKRAVRAWFVLVLATVVIAFESRLWIVGLAAIVAVFIWPARSQSVTFRIDARMVDLDLGRPKVAPVRFPLDALLDVRLDTKTVGTVREGDSLVLATRLDQRSAGLEIEKARIVLHFEDESSVALSEEYDAHMDAAAWLGKIRVFLRRHGWLPEDERAS